MSEEKRCQVCGSTKQVVTVAGRGNFCAKDYPAIKRGRAQPTEVKSLNCSNCGGPCVAGRCIRCGAFVDETGKEIRVG